MSVTNLGPWQNTAQHPRLDSDTPVSRLMTNAPAHAETSNVSARVHALTTVREATHLMASRGVLQIHVEDSFGNVVGVLTVSDLYRWVTATPTDDDSDGPTAGHA